MKFRSISASVIFFIIVVIAISFCHKQRNTEIPDPPPYSLDGKLYDKLKCNDSDTCNK